MIIGLSILYNFLGVKRTDEKIKVKIKTNVYIYGIYVISLLISVSIALIQYMYTKDSLLRCIRVYTFIYTYIRNYNKSGSEYS